MKSIHFFLFLTLIVIIGGFLINERQQEIPQKAKNISRFTSTENTNTISKNKSISTQIGDSNTTSIEPECLHPGYGEINIHSIKLGEKKVIAHEGDKVVVRGNITGKEYHVGESGGSKNTCHYDGCVVLKAYLGPEAPKSSWSYMQRKLTEVEGLDIKITPQKFCLKPNETMEFQVEITPQKAGTYYLYIVAFGDKGWKSWDVIEVKVS